MLVPTELNGYPVIKSEQHANGYATVMCAKDNTEKPREYIVATWYADLKRTWTWGHYFSCGQEPSAQTIEEAKVKADHDFFETSVRNARR